MSDHPSFILLAYVSESIPIDKPKDTMADKYMNIPLNQPVFNWESTNMIEEWKHFHGQVELLLDIGPFSKLEEPQKVATLQNWMSDKGQKIYKDELTFSGGKDKNKLKDVLDAFEAHFTPLQSMIHSWYSLGALHSHQCKDQSDFMSCLHTLARDCGFTNED